MAYYVAVAYDPDGSSRLYHRNDMREAIVGTDKEAVIAKALNTNSGMGTMILVGELTEVAREPKTYEIVPIDEASFAHRLGLP